MSLPKIDTPLFEMDLISQRGPVTYRPFLVKEEKLLLMAIEGGDENEMLRATRQIVNNCLVDKVDVDSLPLFDLQYAMLKIRSKSVGEDVDLMLKHPEEKNKNGEICDASTSVKIDISNIKITKDAEHSKIIRLTNEISIEMKYPTISVYNNLAKMTEENSSGVNELFDIMIGCINVIYSGEESFSASEYSKQDLEDFLGSLTSEQFEKIKIFFNTMPALLHDVSWVCKTCGCEETVTLNGVGDFFL